MGKEKEYNDIAFKNGKTVGIDYGQVFVRLIERNKFV